MIRSIAAASLMLSVALAPMAAFAQSAPSSSPAAPVTAPPINPSQLNPYPAQSKPEVAKTAPAAEQTTDLRVSNLIGANIKNASNETVGEIADMLLDANSGVKAYIVSVGGFLGIGEHHVAVAPADVTMTRDGANSVALTMNATKEQMKARPEFKYVSSWRTDDVKSTSSIGSGSVADEATARARAEGMGYTNVAALSKNAAGVWMGSAKKDGRDVTVMIDATGRVSTK